MLPWVSCTFQLLFVSTRFYSVGFYTVSVSRTYAFRLMTKPASEMFVNLFMWLHWEIRIPDICIPLIVICLRHFLFSSVSLTEVVCPLLSPWFLKLKTYSALKRLGSLGSQIFKDLEMNFIIVLIFFVLFYLGKTVELFFLSLSWS